MGRKCGPGTAAALVCLAFLAGCSTAHYGGGLTIETGEPTPTTKTRPPSAQKGMETAAANHIRSAHRFLAKGMPDNAIRELDKAREKSGTSFWYFYLLGGAQYQRGSYSQAADYWEMSLRYAGGDVVLLSRIKTCQSYAFLGVRSTDTAIELAEAAIQYDSGNREARVLLGDLTQPSGKAGGKGRGKGKGKGQNKGQGKGSRSEQSSRFETYFLEVSL